MTEQKLSSPSRRRGQPRDLTRIKIIETSLDLIEREGSDSLTMRSVADALGVTPMALYNHVSSKHDLLRAIAAHVLESASFDGGKPEWRPQVEFCFHAFREVCLRHPDLARMLETAEVAPLAIFVPMEITLKALRSAGLTGIDAARTYYTLVSFTLVQTSYLSRGPYQDLDPSEAIRSERIAGRGYEAIEQFEMSRQWDFDAAFEFGLCLILDGVEAQIHRRNDTLA